MRLSRLCVITLACETPRNENKIIKQYLPRSESNDFLSPPLESNAAKTRMFFKRDTTA